MAKVNLSKIPAWSKLKLTGCISAKDNHEMDAKRCVEDLHGRMEVAVFGSSHSEVCSCAVLGSVALLYSALLTSANLAVTTKPLGFSWI